VPGLAALRRLWSRLRTRPLARHRLEAGRTVFAVPLPAVTVETPTGRCRVARRTLKVERPVPEAATGAGILLTTGAYTALGRFWIDHVRAVRDDGTALAEGVHFTVDRITGRLRSACDARCSAAYDWAPHRYDVVALDPETGQVHVLRGPDRARDPNEHIPVPPAGWVALFTLYVNRDFCEAIPVHDWRGVVRRGGEGAHEAWLREARRRLPNTMRRLGAGDPLTVAAYGDSTGALGDSTDIAAPDGQRDTVAFWAGYPDDTLARLDRIAGALGPDAHMRDGWNWRLVRGLQDLYGSPCTYRNWCVGATVVGRDTAADGCLGGLHPARLAAFLAGDWDLAVIQFGGNAIDPRTYGGTYSYDGTRTLVAAIQATGREAIVLGLPRLNPCSSAVFTRHWLRVNRQIVRAARDAGAAHVDFAAISGPGREGGLGLSPLTMGEQNLFNHPGLYEHARYADYILEIFRRDSAEP
jgi:hypothetical protein